MLHHPQLAHEDSTLRVADETRHQAGRLLRRLLIEQHHSDERFAQAGRRDPIKALTGFSALERAVVTTRDLISRIEEVMAELEAESPGQPLEDTETRQQSSTSAGMLAASTLR